VQIKDLERALAVKNATLKTRFPGCTLFRCNTGFEELNENIMQRPSDSPRLNSLEGRLIAWAQMTEVACATTEQIEAALRLSQTTARKLLSSLAGRGLILQLQRGLYLIPDKLPPSGRWQPPAELAVWHYMRFKSASWQETGPAAFQHYGLSTQLSNQLMVYNDQVSGKRCFGRLEVRFIKTPKKRLGHTQSVPLPAYPMAERRLGTLPRVVFDAIYDDRRFATLPRAYGWIAERKTDNAFLVELVNCALEHGNVATQRRLGWALDLHGAKENHWQRLKRAIKPTSSYIPVDPRRPAQGRINKRWGVLDNG
jgi:predicted transcriptional regulator of viral defense system